jgi:hypothetical protein
MSIELVKTEPANPTSQDDNTSLELHGLMPRPYIDIVLEHLALLADTPRCDWLAGNVPFGQLPPNLQGLAELLICDELACLIGLFIPEGIRATTCNKIVRYLKAISKKVSGIDNRLCVALAITWFNDYRRDRQSLSPQILDADQRAINAITALNHEPLARWSFNSRTYKELNSEGNVAIHDLVENTVVWRIDRMVKRVEIPASRRPATCHRLISELKHLNDWRVSRASNRQVVLHNQVWLARYREGLLRP